MDTQRVAIPVSLAQAIVDLGRQLVPFLAAEEPGHGAERPDSEEALVVTVPGQGDWTQQHIELMRPEVMRLPGAVALLNVAAEHPDAVVTYSQVKDRAELESNALRAQLSAMTKGIRRAMGSNAKWPLQAWQDAETGEMRYRMPRGIADWWRAA
jgi:hypothetical protein